MFINMSRIVKTAKTLVTYLEMLKRKNTSLPAFPNGIELKLVNKIDVDDYIRLYKRIGTEYYWTSRLLISKAELTDIIHHPRTKIFVLYENSLPIGFFELNSRNAPRSVEISFIGLVNSSIGKGLGTYLTQYAIAHAWAQNPGRLIIQTCTLDHKRALPLYQRLGFNAFNRHVAEFKTLDQTQ